MATLLHGISSPSVKEIVAPDWSLYPNFTVKEFTCRCGCNRSDMDTEFMHKLQQLRLAVGPLKITSGFRCASHPEERKKKAPGAHSAGLAADVVPLSCGRYEFLKTALDLDFVGIGVAKSFIHLDTGHPTAGRPALWSY
ncbi:D-Ala-D-Ala carboxypeptidase family metallohydrolase [Kiloniella laminariae]|uniref:D-Ala-D-Ala carboxypeptidase family metallohydrolase n=1 Tax=Kiloniella laminariae TaxID=454162 RepID=UPI000369E1C6|nr:D-Ala-D-Ala carboxypeptidase family metallohydrolase [Kiloniella laminariae]